MLWAASSNGRTCLCPTSILIKSGYRHGEQGLACKYFLPALGRGYRHWRYTRTKNSLKPRYWIEEEARNLSYTSFLSFLPCGFNCSYNYPFFRCRCLGEKKLAFFVGAFFTTINLFALLRYKQSQDKSTIYISTAPPKAGIALLKAGASAASSNFCPEIQSQFQLYFKAHLPDTSKKR